MLECRRYRLIIIAAFAIACIIVSSSPALAQCAMCKAAVEGATDGAALIRRLNLGIFILLVPPVGMFCGAFGLAYRYRHGKGEIDGDD